MRVSARSRVSNSLGTARGLPVRFVRGRLVVREEAPCCAGRDWLEIDGELDGDADMRISLSPSSSAFRFLLPIILGEGELNTVARLVSINVPDAGS